MYMHMYMHMYVHQHPQEISKSRIYFTLLYFAL